VRVFRCLTPTTILAATEMTRTTILNQDYLDEELQYEKQIEHELAEILRQCSEQQNEPAIELASLFLGVDIHGHG